MYTISQDHYVQEFDIQLYEGGTVEDGELEPDLIAQLVSQGVLAPVVSEEEATPVRRRGNRRSEG